MYPYVNVSQQSVYTILVHHSTIESSSSNSAFQAPKEHMFLKRTSLAHLHLAVLLGTSQRLHLGPRKRPTVRNGGRGVGDVDDVDTLPRCQERSIVADLVATSISPMGIFR